MELSNTAVLKLFNLKSPLHSLNGVLGAWNQLVLMWSLVDPHSASPCAEWCCGKQKAATYDVLMELMKRSQGAPGLQAAHIKKLWSNMLLLFDGLSET